MLQPQQPVTNQIKSRFLSYHMQTPTKESDPYQPQQSLSSDHLGNKQKRIFFPY